MNDRERMALERLLRETHSIVGERIDDRLPGPHDDAQAEYLEECAIGAAREFVTATASRSLAIGKTTIDIVGVLQGLYDLLPPASCQSLEPDGCVVCLAREFLLARAPR